MPLLSWYIDAKNHLCVQKHHLWGQICCASNSWFSTCEAGIIWFRVIANQLNGRSHREETSNNHQTDAVLLLLLLGSRKWWPRRLEPHLLLILPIEDVAGCSKIRQPGLISKILLMDWFHLRNHIDLDAMYKILKKKLFPFEKRCFDLMQWEAG